MLHNTECSARQCAGSEGSAVSARARPGCSQLSLSVGRAFACGPVFRNTTGTGVFRSPQLPWILNGNVPGLHVQRHHSAGLAAGARSIHAASDGAKAPRCCPAAGPFGPIVPACTKDFSPSRGPNA